MTEESQTTDLMTKLHVKKKMLLYQTVIASNKTELQNYGKAWYRESEVRISIIAV